MRFPFPTMDAFATALVNHLWQSTAVLVAAWLLARALHHNRAAVSYCLWMAASLKFLLPFSLLMAAGAIFHPATGFSVERQAMSAAMEQIVEPLSQSASAVLEPPAVLSHSERLPLLLFLLWAGGALVVAGSWCRGWMRIRAAVRASSPRTFTGNVPVRTTSTLLEPGIFGVFRPVLLLPEGIVNRLTESQLNAIVAHELCHVKRRDNLLYALHMAVEALFWFYPPVWWIGSRLIEERERACDEAVVQSGNGAEIYAESIVSVCKFCLESPLACAAGVSGSDLKQRIIRIMSGQRGVKLTFGGKTLLVLAAAIAAAGPIGFGILRAAEIPGALLHAGSGPLPSFEVATIKPSSEDRASFWIRMSPEAFAAKHTSMKDLIKYAYHVKSNDQILGSPAWANSQFFDIEAKASESEIAGLAKLPFDQRMDESRLMVQSLLAERFHLNAHFEARELPVFDLTLAKGGPKLKEVVADPFPPPGTPPPPGAHLTSIGMRTAGRITGTAVPMRMMADWLSNFDELGNRVVMDDTGLKGTYDFTLDGVSIGPSQDPSVTSIFTALQEQLGLKLVPRKATIEVLVVDHVEEPSPN
jgi:bla regulator protein blaR1